jgi:hypothetical protein
VIDRIQIDVDPDLRLPRRFPNQRVAGMRSAIVGFPPIS